LCAVVLGVVVIMSFAYKIYVLLSVFSSYLCFFLFAREKKTQP